MILAVVLYFIANTMFSKRAITSDGTTRQRLRQAMSNIPLQYADLSCSTSSALARASQCQASIAALPFFNALVHEIERSGMLEQTVETMDQTFASLKDVYRVFVNSESVGPLIGAVKQAVPNLTPEARDCLTRVCPIK